MSLQGEPSAAGAPARKQPKVEPPTQNPDPTFCSYYVTRKHRFCRTECRPGSRFCCTHDVDAAAVSLAEATGPSASAAPPPSESRVPCPINPNHTVYASRLEKHVKVCPDLRYVTDQLSYYAKDKHANRGAVYVAGGATVAGEGGGSRCTHRDLAAADLAALIERVHACYDACVAADIVVLPLSEVEEEGCGADASRNSAAARSAPREAAVPRSQPPSTQHDEGTSHKHGPQHTALLRCLSDVVLQVPDGPSILSGRLDGSGDGHPAAPIHLDGVLEFGAGKGGLSVALQQLLVQRLDADANTAAAATTPWPFLAQVAPRPPLVVLDMDGFRRKGDARVRHSAVPLQRLRINIKDVDLTGAFLSDIRPADSGVAKAAESSRSVAARPVQNWAVLGKHLCGACTDFALSCLTEGASLATDAQVRLPAVVIATCCHHRCELRHLNPPSEVAEARPATLVFPGTAFAWTEVEFAALTSMSSWSVCGDFVDEERRTVGRKCKRIIDQLRVHFLRRIGYVAFQCQYTTRQVTEENVCIVAFQN